MSIAPVRCRQHPHFYEPCSMCKQLREMYDMTPQEQRRMKRCQQFTNEHPEPKHWVETHVVLSDWNVDDDDINSAIEALEEKIDRLSPYPDWKETRDLAIKTRDFMMELLSEQ